MCVCVFVRASVCVHNVLERTKSHADSIASAQGEDLGGRKTGYRKSAPSVCEGEAAAESACSRMRAHSSERRRVLRAEGKWGLPSGFDKIGRGSGKTAMDSIDLNALRRDIVYRELHFQLQNTVSLHVCHKPFLSTFFFPLEFRGYVPDQKRPFGRRSTIGQTLAITSLCMACT